MSSLEKLSPEQRAAAEALQKKVAEAGGEEGRAQLEREKRFSRAKWKMQIWIKSERSIHKPLAFTLSIWESGKRLHGGGDESAFICRRRPSAAKPKMPFYAARPAGFKREATADGCDGVISGDNAVRNRIVCPHCGLSWDTEQIADALFYRLPVEKAAEVLADWHHELGGDADLYVKYRDEDIRVRMMAEHFGVRKARELKGLTIYPLAHIVRDLAGGASLASRFKALLLA
jgi:hypothetical protein